LTFHKTVIPAVNVVYAVLYRVTRNLCAPDDYSTESYEIDR
jgi:hypothetical protein